MTHIEHEEVQQQDLNFIENDAQVFLTRLFDKALSEKLGKIEIRAFGNGRLQ